MKQSVRSIIREEVEKIVRGVDFTDDRLNFNQLIVYPNVEFNNYDSFTNDFDVRITTGATINVNWGISFQINQYGIQNFQINIKGVNGQYHIQYLDKQSDKIMQEKDDDIKNINWKYTVTENVPLITKGTLYVKGLKFNFKDNTCFVEFYKSKNVK